jgi:dihydrodipicolinate synthase/N-acetylneuraminate lyase
MQGVYAALATPLDEDGQLDRAGLARLVERIVRGGADGLSPAGSTGEGAHLSPGQRVELTAQVRELVPDGMPVITGAPLRDVAAGERYLADLAAAGASAALVSLQAAYPLGAGDVASVYHRLADSAALPIVLYNIPVFTRVVIAPDLVGELAGHPNVIGIKDSSGDIGYLQEVIYATGSAQFSVLTGTDNLLVASLALGAHGTLAASVNLVPELAVGICRAFAAGDLPAARGLQQRLTQVIRACGRGAAAAGWKAALALAGVCSDAMVPPTSSLRDPERAALAAELVELGVQGVAG